MFSEREVCYFQQVADADISFTIVMSYLCCYVVEVTGEASTYVFHVDLSVPDSRHLLPNMCREKLPHTGQEVQRTDF